MKMNFVKYFILGGVVLTITGISACSNKPDDAKEAAEERNEEVMDTRKSEKDAQFVVDAAEINLMEIHMGQLGTKKATMSEVKQFAEKMESDHQKAYNDLASLASSKNISIPASPSEDTMKEHKDLAEKSGYDFDRKYCDMMVDGHEKAINKFQKAADDCEDADLKAWASKMLPDLAAHLETAKLLKEKVKDMK
ncbi:MAG: DUF4142 domain-containing protein [Bacteroidetes bacterium]|nr:DUF4142 domain-containing protein [Bacteroidota bacterium]